MEIYDPLTWTFPFQVFLVSNWSTANPTDVKCSRKSVYVVSNDRILFSYIHLRFQLFCVCACLWIYSFGFFFFPSEKYRFLISLILFFHFRSCYMKFQIRLQENQFSFLCLNRPLKCLDLMLKNFCFTEFVCFGCAGGAEHSVLDASTLNFISRRFLTKGKQWIILIVWESNFQKHALAVEYQCCFNCRFHLPSSKSTMNVTVHMFCTPSLFYLLAFRVYWFYYSSLQEERN